MLTNEDIAQVQKQMELVFVTRRECDDTSSGLDRKLQENDVRLAVIEQKIRINNWLSTAIAGGVIAALIKLFIG